MATLLCVSAAFDETQQQAYEYFGVFSGDFEEAHCHQSEETTAYSITMASLKGMCNVYDHTRRWTLQNKM